MKYRKIIPYTVIEKLKIILSCNLKIVLVILVGFTSEARLFAEQTEEQIVNPHWTGKNCIECHLVEHPSDSTTLKFHGDTVQLCNRCHESEFVRADIHPVEVELTPQMKDNIPKHWPLMAQKLTCLTCHDAKQQIYENIAVRELNPKFLRGAPYKKITDFCFSCHQKTEYKKANPHKQLDKKGNIIERRCLFCHQYIPDPRHIKGIEEVSFKSELAVACTICHQKEKTAHPARAEHLLELPDKMKKAFKLQLVSLGVDLPLDKGSIFCGTCHNPHEKGVIEREEASRGAGEKNFLRLDAGYELCTICHFEKRLQQARRSVKPEKDLLKTAPKVVASHSPMAENRCKVCHSITVKHRNRPRAVFLCFKQGCHEAEKLENKYVHEKSVNENCYLCHESHTSRYKMLLKINEEKLCYTCHPLLRDKNKEQPKEIDTTSSNEEHKIFNEYLKTTVVPIGNECWFCHSPHHKEKIVSMNISSCSDCHIYVRDILFRSSGADTNVHQTFKQTLCSACHDPHAGPYKYQLKKPRDSYMK